MNRVKHIIHGKYNRQRSWGLADDDTIYIDIRCKGRKHMETALHETLHVIFPKLDEATIILASKELTRIMWKLEYRRIDNDKSQPLQTLKNA